MKDYLSNSQTTKRINQGFNDLEKSFNIEQRNDLERKGFTFLEASQLKQILHQHGISHFINHKPFFALIIDKLRGKVCFRY